MDFKIKTDPTNNSGKLTWLKNTDISTDVYLSLFTKSGTAWQRPDFGCKLWTITKVTTNTVNLAKQYITDALTWLLEVGRASAIDVIVEKDLTNLGQLDISVTVTQANGIPITYQMWCYVGDSAAGQTFATQLMS